MSTRGIIDRAKALARDFAQKDHKQVRLPAFYYDDWCSVYARPDNAASREQYRQQARHTWYLIHYLREKGIKVDSVPVRKEEFLTWAGKGGHSLKNSHDRGHAVGDYVNRSETPVAPCRHDEAAELLALAGDEPHYATITVFGESPQEPEIMSVVLHRFDGSVILSQETLAAEHGPQEAWDLTTAFLDKHQPEKVFHDREIRQPSFCQDCGALLVHVASPEDLKSMG